eukprot:1869012-Amphidinium_carterae.1
MTAKVLKLSVNIPWGLSGLSTNLYTTHFAASCSLQPMPVLVSYFQRTQSHLRARRMRSGGCNQQKG